MLSTIYIHITQSICNNAFATSSLLNKVRGENEKSDEISCESNYLASQQQSPGKQPTRPHDSQDVLGPSVKENRAMTPRTCYALGTISEIREKKKGICPLANNALMKTLQGQNMEKPPFGFPLWHYCEQCFCEQLCFNSHRCPPVENPDLIMSYFSNDVKRTSILGDTAKRDRGPTVALLCGHAVPPCCRAVPPYRAAAPCRRAACRLTAVPLCCTATSDCAVPCRAAPCRAAVPCRVPCCRAVLPCRCAAVPCRTKVPCRVVTLRDAVQLHRAVSCCRAAAVPPCRAAVPLYCDN